MLFIVLDVILLKQINFPIFFLCLSIPQLVYYLLFPETTCAIDSYELSAPKNIHLTLAKKVGYVLVFLGGLTTLGTAYYQYISYGPSTIKGAILIALSLLLIGIGVYGWLVNSETFRRR